ncbi:uncharacterized protein LOC133308224, partial [Gastrolobium bilobum]|uniref:uncharacterized protein LOC133308224 n=1 Tax=Gastrolobium bilobum TaxID=150636 RepID=UPI002AB03A20
MKKNSVLNAIKVDPDGIPIVSDGKTIPDAVNQLIFTIIQHFIGDPSLWKDRSAELLSNLKCRTLGDFRWYKDTFLTRVYTRDDSQQPFWKEKFLAGLPKSLGDKVRDKIRHQSLTGDIPYEQLSYGQLVAYIQKVALKICQDDKIQRQLAKEKTQNRKDLGSFCEQFGLPCTTKPKKHKKQEQKQVKTFRNFRKKPNYNKRLKKKLNNLNLDPSIEEQINNLLIQSSDEESGKESSEDLNQIHEDDLSSSEDSQSSQEINVLTKEQDLLFEVIDSISNFDLEIEALFDTGADSNCIQEGLIPTKYFEKTSERLSTASGSKLQVNYKLPKAIIESDNLKVETPFLLVKNLKNGVILGTPFIKSLFPLTITDEEIADLIAKGLIRKSKSPWSCSAFYVNKQSEIERGTPRLVTNYKPLNQALQWIRYPIPNKKDLLNRLYSAKIFSKFDMKSGFWQIQLNDNECYKTAFTVPFGQYEWKVMPFGLKNAPSEFQRIMNDIFNPYSTFTIVYIDDVLVFSQSIDQHFKHLHIFVD